MTARHTPSYPRLQRDFHRSTRPRDEKSYTIQGRPCSFHADATADGGVLRYLSRATGNAWVAVHDVLDALGVEDSDGRAAALWRCKPENYRYAPGTNWEGGQQGRVLLLNAARVPYLIETADRFALNEPGPVLEWVQSLPCHR